MKNNIQSMAINFAKVIESAEGKIILLSGMRSAGDMDKLYMNMLNQLRYDGNKYLYIQVGKATEERGFSDYILDGGG